MYRSSAFPHCLRCFSPCLFKPPPLRNTQSALIGELTQVRANTSHCVFNLLCCVFLASSLLKLKAGLLARCFLALQEQHFMLERRGELPSIFSTFSSPVTCTWTCIKLILYPLRMSFYSQNMKYLFEYCSVTNAILLAVPLYHNIWPATVAYKRIQHT